VRLTIGVGRDTRLAPPVLNRRPGLSRRCNDLAVVLAWTAEAWTALATWATFTVIAGSLAFAWRQVAEARTLREEQTRPFVVVDLEPGWIIYLTIENVGRTLARNVRVEFEPPLSSTRADVRFEEIPALRDGIPTLPPGRKFRYFFDSSIERLNRTDLPRSYEVEVRYGRHDDRDLPLEKYVLDLHSMLESSPPDEPLHDVAKALKGIKDEVAKWGDGLDGLRVIDRTEQTLQVEAERREERTRRMAQETKVRPPASDPD
jgi:hypothetical protein